MPDGDLPALPSTWLDTHVRGPREQFVHQPAQTATSAPGTSAAAPAAQAGVPPAPSNRTAAQIVEEPRYFDNGIIRIISYSLQQVDIYYRDGSNLRLGLVPEYIEPPFEGVDYRTPAHEHLRIPAIESGTLRYIPRAMRIEDPPGTTLGMLEAQLGISVHFLVHTPSGRIVPTEVNTLTAPYLCEALRREERNQLEFVRASGEMLEDLELMVLLATVYEPVAGGVARASVRQAERAALERAATGTARAVSWYRNVASRLYAEFRTLLRSGAAGDITIEGVRFGGVRVVREGTTLFVRRASIFRLPGARPGQGRIIHAAYERAAVETAREAGVTSVEVVLETVVNSQWRSYLFSIGYSVKGFATAGRGIEFPLVRVIQAVR